MLVVSLTVCLNVDVDDVESPTFKETPQNSTPASIEASKDLLAELSAVEESVLVTPTVIS